MALMKTAGAVACMGDAFADMILPYGQSKQATARIAAGGQPDKSLLPGPKLVGGGAVCNTAAGLAKLGVPTLFIGRVGKDPVGRFVKEDLESCGVNTRYLQMEEERQTRCVINIVDEDKDRFFYLWPTAGAAEDTGPPALPDPAAGDFSWVHTTGAFLCGGDGGEEALVFLQRCAALGIAVSFDINLRTEVYGFDHRIASLIRGAIACSSVVLGSRQQELPLAAGIPDPEAAAKSLAVGDRIVVSRDGADPVWV